MKILKQTSIFSLAMLTLVIGQATQPINKYFGNLNGAPWATINMRTNDFIAVDIYKSWYTIDLTPLNNWGRTYVRYGTFRTSTSQLKGLIYHSARNRYIAFYNDGIWAKTLDARGDFTNDKWYRIGCVYDDGDFSPDDISYTYDFRNNRVLVLKADGRIIAVNFDNLLLNPTGEVIAPKGRYSNTSSICYVLKNGRQALIANKNGKLIYSYIWTNSRLSYRQNELERLVRGTKIVYNSFHQTLLLIEPNSRVYQRVLNF